MTEVNGIEKLPEGWKRVRLGEVASFHKGRFYLKSDATEDGIYEFIHYGELFTVYKEQINNVVSRINNNKGAFFSKANDVLIPTSDVTPSGLATASCVKKDEVILGSDILVIRCFNRNRVDGTFLAYLVRFNKNKILRLVKGTTVYHIYASDLKSFGLPYPPLPEQHKIAEILETVDNAIEKTNKIIEKYKRIKRGLMQDLLTKGVDENGKIRSEETHKFKDSPLVRIPKGWKVVRLGDVCKVKRGASPRPIDDPIYFTEEGRGRSWVRIEDIVVSNKHLRKTKQYLSKSGEEKSVKVEIGEIIMSICATIGKPVIVDISACIHDGFVAFKKLSINVDKEYLYYFISFKEKEFSKLEQIGTQGNLNSMIVSNISIPLPPLPEQHRIASILSRIDEMIEKEQVYKQKLERIKQGLMEDLLTGKIRVNL